MKSLYETLSDASIKQIVDYLKSAEGLNDDNIADYIKILSTEAKKSGIKQQDYETFFDKHGLTKLNWGRKNSARKQFVNLFMENDNIEALSYIVKNDGMVSINDINVNGNIFDYCKNSQCDFVDEAHTIATWINSTSANAGPCEMLLKFILKEGTTLSQGDVGIMQLSNEEEMEVKAATTGKNASGGHAAGQKGNNGQKIRGAWSIYLYLNEKLFNMKNNNAVADKSAYLQNENGLNKFNQLLKNNNLLNNDKSIRKISDNIVDAIAFQYNFITNENYKKADNYYNFEDKLKESSYDYCKSIITNNGFNKQDLLNLIGCIQLYLYSQIEKFQYFFCIQIDKSDESTNKNNGNYWCVKDCQSNDSTLLKFNKVINNLYFGALDSPTSSQGRTGKIYMKQLNIQ